MDRARVVQIMSGEATGAGAALVRLGLGTMTPAYRLAVQARNRLFDFGVKRAHPLGRPTISVGNLTTGGTGKTPIVIEVVRRLLAMGERPAVLMRGYHATAAGSDEAREIAAAAPEAIVEPDPDRVAAAGRVLAQAPQTSVFILDDGFQHRRANRDLDLVLIDATRPFGFDRLLPRGLLREPPASLRRADGVIVTRVEQVDAAAVAAIDARVAALTGRPPVAHAVMRWVGLREGDAETPVASLRGLRVVGLCGIGNPGAFERMLREAAGSVAEVLVYPDHQDYGSGDWTRVVSAVERASADAVVTTEKDWVKLGPLSKQSPKLRVLRPVLGVHFVDGDAAVTAMLQRAAASSGAAAAGGARRGIA